MADLYSTRIKSYGTDIVGKAGEAINAGLIVYASGIDSGTPIYTKALATNASKVAGVLYFLVGKMAGGNAANGDLIRIASATHVTGIAGNPAVGDAVYVNDSAGVSLTAGTVSRKIGRVFYSTGGFYGFTFDGVSGIAAPPPTGTANTLTKFDNAGNLAASNITEDNASLLAIFTRGMRLDLGPLYWDPTDVFKAAGENYDAVVGDVYLVFRLNGGAGANRTVLLPPAPTDGRVLMFADGDGQANVNNITLIGKTGGVGYPIEAADTMVMSAAQSAGILVFFRDRWKVLANRQT